MPSRRQVIELFSPVLGLKSDNPSTMLDDRSQPEGKNNKLYFGVNQKEWGTSLYLTGSGSVIAAPHNGIYDATFSNGSILQVFNATGVYKYTSSGDTLVSDGQTFSGTYSDFWSACLHNDQFFYANGNNPLQVKSSLSVTGTDFPSAVTPSTLTAYSLLSVNEHLNLYHVWENGAQYNKRVQWSEKGVLSLSSTTCFSGGLAGAIDLPDAEGEIKCACHLGGAVAVYAERSVHIQYWTGDSEVYKFEKKLNGIGTPSRRGAISRGDVNYFFSHNNIYAYYGGTDLRPIGDPIRKMLFGDINDSKMAEVWLEYNDTYDELHVHIPTARTDPAYTDLVYVYKTTDGSWSKIERTLTCGTVSTRRTGLTIGELVGAMGDQNFTYGSFQVNADSPLRVYGTPTGHVVKYDLTTYSVCNSGTQAPQVFVYETPDLVGANLVDPYDKEKVDFTTTDKRWNCATFSLKGNGTALLKYSVDNGASFTEFAESPVTLSPVGTLHSVGMCDRSKSIRLQVSQTGTNDWVGIDYVKLEFVPGGERRI